VTATRLLNQYGPIERFPPNVLGDSLERALLFKKLAILRTDAPLFRSVDELEWHGPRDDFAAWADKVHVPRLLERSLKARVIPPPR
jgi:hypothetical protein